jgi:hypothetical protein
MPSILLKGQSNMAKVLPEESGTESDGTLKGRMMVLPCQVTGKTLFR